MWRSQFFGFIQEILNSLFLWINSFCSSKWHRRWAATWLFISIGVSWILLMIPRLPSTFRLGFFTKIWCSLCGPNHIRCFGMQYPLPYYTGLLPLRMSCWFLSTLPTLFSVDRSIYNQFFLHILSIFISHLMILFDRLWFLISTLKETV